MNENLQIPVAETKTYSSLFAVLLALRKAIIGFIWHYATLSFGADENREKKGIYAASYYDFEENTGIDFNHASSAFQCFQNMTAEMKTEMTGEVYEDLLANQNNYDVKFTETENIGIVHVIAKIMTSKPHITNSHSQQTIKDFGSSDSILKRLVIELACHIKMRRKGGSVCLTQYNEYLYSNDDFKRHKKKLMEIEDLNARATEENKILTRMHTSNVLNGLYNRFVIVRCTTDDIDRHLLRKS